jgi:dTMP kinase
MPQFTALPHHRRLLAGRPFRLWFAAALSGGLGDWLGLFALQVLVVSLSDAGTANALFGLGGVMMAKLLPSVLFGPLAGVIADRLDRKRLLVGVNVGRAALFVVVAFTRSIWLLLLLVVLIECLTILFIAAKNALLPHLVDRDDLTEANQLTLLVTYGPLPFAAAVAAVLSWIARAMERLGLPDLEPAAVALGLNGVTFVVAAILLARMPVAGGARTAAAGGREDGPATTTATGDDDGAGRDGGTGPLRELWDGVRHMVERPIIRSLTIGVVGVFFGAGVVIALGPEFVRSSLQRPEEDWFGLMTVVGAGLLAGMGAATPAAARVPKERLLSAALVPASALVIVIAFLDDYLLVQIAGFALALAAGTAFVLGFTMLHERTPDALRGRIFATFYTVARVAMFAALAFAPFVAAAIGSGTIAAAGMSLPYDGIRLTVAIGGAVGLAGAVPSLLGMVSATRDDGSSDGGADDQQRAEGEPAEDQPDPRRVEGRS